MVEKGDFANKIAKKAVSYKKKQKIICWNEKK